MSLTKVGPKHQVTIPADVFKRLRLEVGDYLQVEALGTTITMAPARLVPKDQAWLHTRKWQGREREADEAIARGQVSGPFRSGRELVRHLRSQRPRKKK